MSVLFHENPGTSLGDARIANDSGDSTETPEWIADLFPNNSFIDGETHSAIRGFCRNVLLFETPILGLRYWDLAILIPNLLFFVFLLCKLGTVWRKIQTSKSPVFKAFFFLVYITTFMNIVRCGVSMAISATNPLGEIVDKVLWISLKFFYMTAELCVLTFALLFGHLDSSTSIRRALIATLLISLAHTAIQTVLELKLIDQSLVENLFFDFESKGGLVFWMLTSTVFSIVYVFVLCLPMTCVRRYVTLPSKCSFYLYCILLASLNIIQALGAFLIFMQVSDGMCFVDLTTFIYFCLYTPIIYFTFLRKLLKRPASGSNGGLFSYRKQKDESGAENLPETYYPRFSGLTSPSYDDLFDVGRTDRFVDYDYTRDYLQCPYDTPLMSSEPAESTITTRTAGSEEARQRDSMLWSGSLEMGPRHLKGLGANGTLVFEETRWK